MKTEPNEKIKMHVPNGYGHDTYDTLTKREHFAALAMQGLIAGRMHEYINDNLEHRNTHEQLAEWAVMDADCLIEALNKTKEK